MSPKMLWVSQVDSVARKTRKCPPHIEQGEDAQHVHLVAWAPTRAGTHSALHWRRNRPGATGNRGNRESEGAGSEDNGALSYLTGFTSYKQPGCQDNGRLRNLFSKRLLDICTVTLSFWPGVVEGRRRKRDGDLTHKDREYPFIRLVIMPSSAHAWSQEDHHLRVTSSTRDANQHFGRGGLQNATIRTRSDTGD